jgi:hypothetical protein
MKSVSYIKSSYLLFIILMIGVTQSSWILDPSNPPSAKTGAPGETTCSTSSGCHTGGTFTGTVELSGIPDTVMPDETYNITLVHTSNAVKAGFEITCLNSNNSFTGTFTAGSGNNVTTNNSNGRKYVRQSTAKTLSGGFTTWSFSWKAPSSTPDNTAKFYFASLAANNNNAKTGDNALTGNKQVVLFTPTVGTASPETKEGLRIYPNPAAETLFVDIEPGTAGNLQIFNLSGKLVKSVDISQATRIDISGFSRGAYIARLQTAQRDYTSRFIVE